MSNGLSDWLRERLERERLSLRKAAAKIGLSHTAIRDILNGVRPTAETVRKLARAFGGNGREAMALEDSLLILAGYRSERPGEDMSPLLGRIMDILSGLDEARLELMLHFADFLTKMEDKTDGGTAEVSDGRDPS